MLINCEQSAATLRLQLQPLYQKLNRLSNLSLIEPQTEKDQFLIDCYTLVYQLTWDSLAGGYYHKKDNQLVLSTSHNAMLAKFFFSVGRALFNGDMSYIGKNLLSNLLTINYSEAPSLLAKEFTYPYSAAPFIFTGDFLQEHLSLDEINLLSCLIKKPIKAGSNDYWINYKTSLERASENANLHFKQAQVIEESIKFKLKNTTQLKCSQAKALGGLDVMASVNCLSVIVFDILWNKQLQHQTELQKIKLALIDWLKTAEINYFYNEVIYVCFGLLDCCQISFDKDCIAVVVASVEKIKGKLRVSELPEQSQQALYCCLVILKDLEILPAESFSDFDSELKRLKNNSEQIKVEVLSGTKIEQENKKEFLLSCYDPTLKIYQLGW